MIQEWYCRLTLIEFPAHLENLMSIDLVLTTAISTVIGIIVIMIRWQFPPTRAAGSTGK
jgi:hypothetical protein